MKEIKKLLVPTDFSPCSQTAIAYAISFAGQLNATLLLIYVLEPVGYPIDFAMIDRPELEEKKKRQALNRVARSARQKGIEVETRLFRGDPSVEIVREAENRHCDLIVMGTHGRKGISHLLMGSVAERVVRTSPVPVVTIRREKGNKPVSQTEPLSAANPAADFG